MKRLARVQQGYSIRLQNRNRILVIKFLLSFGRSLKLWIKGRGIRCSRLFLTGIPVLREGKGEGEDRGKTSEHPRKDHPGRPTRIGTDWNYA